jgi:hypothetical protein
MVWTFINQYSPPNCFFAAYNFVFSALVPDEKSPVRVAAEMITTSAK